MNETMQFLCENIQGAKFGYTQSDEISIVMTDFDTLETDAWFGGNAQKIVSVAASMATAKFNHLANKTFVLKPLAFFDARTFTIPSRSEVVNYFVWRQKDAVRNSISGLAQSLFSQKELHGKNQEAMLEMCKEKGKDWNKVAEDKNGRAYKLHTEWRLPADSFDQEAYAERHWKLHHDIPNFWENRQFIEDSIPILE